MVEFHGNSDDRTLPSGGAEISNGKVLTDCWSGDRNSINEALRPKISLGNAQLTRMEIPGLETNRQSAIVDSIAKASAKDNFKAVTNAEETKVMAIGSEDTLPVSSSSVMVEQQIQNINTMESSGIPVVANDVIALPSDEDTLPVANDNKNDQTVLATQFNANPAQSAQLLAAEDRGTANPVAPRSNSIGQTLQDNILPSSTDQNRVVRSQQFNTSPAQSVQLLAAEDRGAANPVAPRSNSIGQTLQDNILPSSTDQNRVVRSQQFNTSPAQSVQLLAAEDRGAANPVAPRSNSIGQTLQDNILPSSTDQNRVVRSQQFNANPAQSAQLLAAEDRGAANPVAPRSNSIGQTLQDNILPSSTDQNRVVRSQQFNASSAQPTQLLAASDRATISNPSSNNNATMSDSVTTNQTANVSQIALADSSSDNQAGNASDSSNSSQSNSNVVDNNTDAAGAKNKAQTANQQTADAITSDSQNTQMAVAGSRVADKNNIVGQSEQAKIAQNPEASIHNPDGSKLATINSDKAGIADTSSAGQSVNAFSQLMNTVQRELLFPIMARGSYENGLVANPMLMHMTDVGVGKTQTPGALGMPSTLPGQKESLTVISNKDIQATLQNQQGQGVGAKLGDDTNKMVVKGSNILGAPFDTTGVIPTGKKSVTPIGTVTDFSPGPVLGVPITKTGAVIAETDPKLVAGQTSTSPLIVTAVSGVQVAGQSTASTTTQQPASTDPNAPKGKTQPKDPDATDFESIMAQFPDPNKILPLSSRKDVEYELVDVEDNRALRVKEDSNYDFNDDIGKRATGQHIIGSISLMSDQELILGQIADFAILNWIHGRKPPVNKAGLAALFNGLHSFNKHEEYEVKNEIDTIESICINKHGDAALAMRLYQENVGRGIIEPIENENDIRAIRNLRPKLKPGKKLLLLSDADIFHYRTSQQVKSSKEVKRTAELKSIRAIPALVNAFKTFFAQISNLKDDTAMKAAFKDMGAALVSQGRLSETTNYGKTLSPTAKEFRLSYRRKGVLAAA